MPVQVLATASPSPELQVVPLGSEEPSEPAPDPSPTAAAEQPVASDPITRTVQLTVGGAVVLGLLGVAGLYLTRGR